MRTVPCKLGELPGLIQADHEALDGRVKGSLVAAASDGAHAIEPNLPIAFGGLRGSLHVDASAAGGGKVRIVLDAPHAAALERGSRPHTPPLEPLIAWVKLRGMQGIDARGRIRSPGRQAWGNTTAANAHSVAVALKRMQSQFFQKTPIDAPRKIARAIQAAIAKHGTRPHWMVRSSLRKIDTTLGQRLTQAVKAGGGGGGSGRGRALSWGGLAKLLKG